MASSKQGAAQNECCHGEVNEQSRHIDEGCDKRSRGAGRVKAQRAQNERQQRAGDAAPEHDPDQTQCDRYSYEKIVLTVGIKQTLPEKNASQSDTSQN